MKVSFNLTTAQEKGLKEYLKKKVGLSKPTKTDVQGLCGRIFDTGVKEGRYDEDLTDYIDKWAEKYPDVPLTV